MIVGGQVIDEQADEAEDWIVAEDDYAQTDKYPFWG